MPLHLGQQASRASCPKRAFLACMRADSCRRSLTVVLAGGISWDKNNSLLIHRCYWPVHHTNVIAKSY